MEAITKPVLLLLLILLLPGALAFATPSAPPSPQCSYAIHVATGCEYGAGTAAVVGVVFKNASATRGQTVGISIVSFYNLNREALEACSTNDFRRNGRCVENIDTMELRFFNSHAGPAAEDWFLESLELEVSMGGSLVQPTITFTVHKWLHARSSEENVFKLTGGQAAGKTTATELAVLVKSLMSLQKSIQDSLVSEMTREIYQYLNKVGEGTAHANVSAPLHKALSDVQAPNLSPIDALNILQSVISIVYQSCLVSAADAAETLCQTGP